MHCSSVDIPLGEGPVNLNWGPIMKTINESPYDFFQQGGWRSFLGGGDADVSSRLRFVGVSKDAELLRKSDVDDASDSESEFEADSEEMQSEESSDAASEYDGSDASADSGSGSGYDDESEGDDWEELERKAAKCMSTDLILVL